MVFSAYFKGLNVIYFFQNNQITSYQDLYDKLVSYINLNMSIYIKLNYPNNSFLEKIFISYDIISFLLIKMNSYENKKDSLKDFLIKKKGCVDENDWRILDSITQIKDYIMNLVPKFLEDNKVSKITFLDEVNNKS